MASETCGRAANLEASTLTEGGRSGLFLRCLDTDERVLGAQGPGAQGQGSIPVFGPNVHREPGDTRLSPPEPVHAVDNFTSALGMGGERRKEASQEAQPDQKAHSDPEPAGYPAPAGTPESTRGPKRPWGHWGPSNV